MDDLGKRSSSFYGLVFLSCPYSYKSSWSDTSSPSGARRFKGGMDEFEKKHDSPLRSSSSRRRRITSSSNKGTDS